MPWKLSFHPAVQKDLRHLPKNTRDVFFAFIPEIAKDPWQGEPLHGPLRNFYKYRFGAYRTAYMIDEQHHEVVVLEVGVRGGFYERLLRRINSFLKK